MEVLNDLVAALKARLPGIHLRTLEEPRGVLALRKSVASLSGQLVPRVLWRWSSASGLWQLGLSDEPTDKPIQEQCSFDEGMNEFRKSNDNIVLALLDPWDELSRPLYQRFLREALAHARGSGKAVILVGRDWTVPIELQPDIFICDLKLPKRADLEEYIQSLAIIYAEKLADKVSIDKTCIPDLARACTGLTLDEAKSIVSLSLVRYRAIGRESISMANREKAQIVRRTGLLEYEESDCGMSEVVANLKNWLEKRGKLFSDAARKAGIKAPKGMLAVGIPGCGKTLVARAIAAAWNQPLVRLDAGKLFGSLVGESEANLRAALRTAEAVAPCVLLLDEIEKGFGNSGGLDGGTSQRVFGALLTWMQDTRSKIFVVGTANDINKLDPALIRRFNAVFAVDLPDYTSRAEILGIHLKRAGHALPKNALAELAQICKGFTGSELEAAVQSALIEAFNDGARKPTAADVTKAIKATVPLSKTMADSIGALREFCKSGRAIPAGATLEDDEAKVVSKGAALEL